MLIALLQANSIVSSVDEETCTALTQFYAAHRLFVFQTRD